MFALVFGSCLACNWARVSSWLAFVCAVIKLSTGIAFIHMY